MSTKEKSKTRRKVYRYSAAFKQKVVSAIETGELTLNEARQKYGIKGGGTIQRWIRQLGKNHLLARVVRIQSVEEMDQTKLLQNRIRELEQALVQTQLECLQSESYLRLACEQMGVDLETFKKKEISKSSNRASPLREE